MKKLLLLIIFLIIPVAIAQFSPPVNFQGAVLIGGEAAKDGLVLTAKIYGIERGSAVIKNGHYNIDVISGREGSDVRFYVGLNQANEIGIYNSGEFKTLDLNFNPFCGDKVCRLGETPNSCPVDCQAQQANQQSNGGSNDNNNNNDNTNDDDEETEDLAGGSNEKDNNTEEDNKKKRGDGILVTGAFSLGNITSSPIAIIAVLLIIVFIIVGGRWYQKNKGKIAQWHQQRQQRVAELRAVRERLERQRLERDRQ